MNTYKTHYFQRPHLPVIIFTLVLLFNQSCSTYNNNLSITQEDAKISFSAGEANIALNKEPFKISFFNQEYSTENFYAAQLVALEDYNTYKSFCSGIPTSESVFFSPGTGMAPDKSGKYESLIITNGAHHYLLYSKDDKKRLVKSGKSGKFLYLDFNIDAIYDGEGNIPISEYNKDDIYIIVFIDRNLDQFIDHSELYKLIVKLK